MVGILCFVYSFITCDLAASRRYAAARFQSTAHADGSSWQDPNHPPPRPGGMLAPVPCWVDYFSANDRL